MNLQGVRFTIARNDMNVQMINGLTGCLSAVIEQIDAGTAGFFSQQRRNFFRRHRYLLDGFLIRFQDVGAVFLWHDDGVTACDLGDIQDRKRMVIFIDNRRRNFMIDDIAKKYTL